MKRLVDLLANKYYLEVNDNLESVFEVGLILAERKYNIDGMTTSNEYEVEVNRFLLTKQKAERLIDFLTNLEYDA